MGLIPILKNRRRMDTHAALSTGPLLTIVSIVIGAVVAMSILASLAPTYMTSLADFVGVFNDVNTTTGDASADSLLGVFALLLAFAGLFAIVGIGVAAARLRKN